MDYGQLRKQFNDGSQVVYRAGVIIKHRDEILWVREHESTPINNGYGRRHRHDKGPGRWGFPKGSARPNEQTTAETAIARCKAEVGIDIDPAHIKNKLLMAQHNGSYSTRIFYHIVCYPDDLPRPIVRPSNDIAEAAWFSIREAQRNEMAEPTRAIVISLAWCTDFQ